jgi:antitoxin ParD1/3/4
MTTFNISLSDEASRFLEEQAAKRGLSTGEEVVARLVSEAMEQERLEQQLVDGIESGSSVVADDAHWDAKRERLIERARGYVA